jgi:hypothetical protein
MTTMMPVIRRFGPTWATAELLPLTDARVPAAPGRGTSYQIQLPGGRTYDWGRVTPPPRNPGQIALHSGRWIATDAAMMGTKAAALYALLGQRSRLWRSVSTTNHWRWARCIEVSSELSPREGAYYAEFQLRFELDAGPWYHEDVSNPTFLLTNNPHAVVVNNTGNAAVENAVLAITAAGSAITHLIVEHWAGYTGWTWTGNLGVGQTLTVDAFNRRVMIGTTDAYSGFAFNTALQKIEEWIYLLPGSNSLAVGRTGGSTASTAQLTFYRGYH